jgi:hypothetical protein
VGEQVTIAACWPKPLVREETITALLEEMLRELGETKVAARTKRSA